jgi:hypothetical protein
VELRGSAALELFFQSCSSAKHALNTPSLNISIGFSTIQTFFDARLIIRLIQNICERVKINMIYLKYLR